MGLVTARCCFPHIKRHLLVKQPQRLDEKLYIYRVIVTAEQNGCFGHEWGWNSRVSRDSPTVAPPLDHKSTYTALMKTFWEGFDDLQNYYNRLYVWYKNCRSCFHFLQAGPLPPTHHNFKLLRWSPSISLVIILWQYGSNHKFCYTYFGSCCHRLDPCRCSASTLSLQGRQHSGECCHIVNEQTSGHTGEGKQTQSDTIEPGRPRQRLDLAIGIVQRI